MPVCSRCKQVIVEGALADGSKIALETDSRASTYVFLEPIPVNGARVFHSQAFVVHSATCNRFKSKPRQPKPAPFSEKGDAA